MLAPPFRRGSRSSSNRAYFTKRSTKPGSAPSPSTASSMYTDKRSVPEFIAARTPHGARRHRRVRRPLRRQDRGQARPRSTPSIARSTYGEDIILAQVALLEAQRSRRRARPPERAVRAPRRRPRPRQHRPVEGADRPHPRDRRLGARNARQDQRSRRRRRAIGGRDARSRADRRRPDPRDRGRAYRSRSRGGRRHPRRRPGRARR